VMSRLLPPDSAGSWSQMVGSQFEICSREIDGGTVAALENRTLTAVIVRQ
jgi:hypothetical protein